MKRHSLERVALLQKILRRKESKLTSRMIRIGFVMALCLTQSALAAPQNVPSASPLGAAAEKCAALMQLNMEDAPGGPAEITSARIVDVPGTGLEEMPRFPGGFGSSAILRASPIHQYCDVAGYVAPQNKFELKLPSPNDWNQKFLFITCGGFCGHVDGAAGNLGLARGFASVTGNGGHDSSWAFDGVWAANAPQLQEDFGWRSNHLVTLIAKAITMRYYGKPITYSYMAGGSKGGQAALLEAQRFPDDFDGVMPIAPVYDFAGRAVIAAAWFAQAVSDGHGGSVLNAAAAQAVHKSVLEHCGAQAGVEEGLVTDPAFPRHPSLPHPTCRFPPARRETVQPNSSPGRTRRPRGTSLTPTISTTCIYRLTNSRKSVYFVCTEARLVPCRRKSCVPFAPRRRFRDMSADPCIPFASNRPLAPYYYFIKIAHA